MTRPLLWKLIALAALAMLAPASLVIADDPQEADAADTKQAEADTKQEDAPTDKKPAEEKPADKKSIDKNPESKRKTHTLKAKPLKIAVTVSGELVARKMTEVVLDADSWTKFKIEEVVPHGARVRAGQTLVRFDPEDLDKAIAELELTQRISEIALIKAEQELPWLEESLERQLNSAQRNWDEAQEDYSRYTDEERDLIVKQYAMRLKQSKFNLDYVRDELEQLKKMYEADDLTEETEEMILRRQQTQYEFAKFTYEMAKYNNALSLGTLLPRQDVRLKEAQRRVELSLERAKMASDLDLSRARYELEKMQIARRKAIEKHSEMIADKRLMTIKSPASGVVYYGRCVNGKWGEITSLKGKLLPEKSVSNNTVMMTVVDPADLFVMGSVAEKDLPSVKRGLPAKLILTAEGVEPLRAVVAKMDAVPAAAGKFGVELNIASQTPEWLMPGMTGKVSITTYNKKRVLMAPKEAIHTDDQNDKKYVWVVEEEDGEVEVEKEWVKTGKSKDKEIEILSGVKAGDLLSLDADEKGTDDDQHEPDE